VNADRAALKAIVRWLTREGHELVTKMSKAAIQFFFRFALLGFFASLVAHVSLYLGSNPQIAFPRTWLFLHLSSIVSIVGLFLAARAAVPNLEVYKTPAAGITKLLCILFVIFLFFALFSFLYHNLLLQWGYISLYQGKLAVLFSNGSLYKILTPEELPTYQKYAARRGSGHWMACHLVAAMVLSIELNLKFGRRNLTTHSTGARDSVPLN
jgi:hypothetical protein